jgi:hypothetical protein
MALSMYQTVVSLQNSSNYGATVVILISYSYPTLYFSLGEFHTNSYLYDHSRMTFPQQVWEPTDFFNAYFQQREGFILVMPS